MENGTHYLLAAYTGILKISIDGLLINRYFKGQNSSCLCHISGSQYLVGFENYKLQVWDEEKNQDLFPVSDDKVCQIKRVLATNNYIIKSETEGVKLLSLDLKNQRITMKNLPDAKVEWSNFTDSLQL